jgi:hypothetical protein
VGVGVGLTVTGRLVDCTPSLTTTDVLPTATGESVILFELIPAETMPAGVGLAVHGPK